MTGPSAAYSDWNRVPIEAQAMLETRGELHYQCVAATFVAGDRYLKVQPKGVYPSLAEEAERMRWAAAWIRVPGVIAHGHNSTTEWLCTSTLPGRDATELTENPEEIVPVFARGLRKLHDSLPVELCPFSFVHEVALPHVRRRQAEGDPKEWHPIHQGLTVKQAIRQLETSPPEERDLVVCHGDYCFPNVLVEEAGVTGYLDVGELGVADRWLDLAVATWTCTWNVGPGYEDLFLEHYSAEWDTARCDWYRLLYEMVS